MLAEHSRLGLLQAVSQRIGPTPQRQFQLSSSTILLVRLPNPVYINDTVWFYFD
jgi:hypothetical protein